MGSYRLKQWVWAAFLYTGKKICFPCLSPWRCGLYISEPLKIFQSSLCKTKEHILSESIIMFINIASIRIWKRPPGSSFSSTNIRCSFVCSGPGDQIQCLAQPRQAGSNLSPMLVIWKFLNVLLGSPPPAKVFLVLLKEKAKVFFPLVQMSSSFCGSKALCGIPTSLSVSAYAELKHISPLSHALAWGFPTSPDMKEASIHTELA